MDVLLKPYTKLKKNKAINIPLFVYGSLQSELHLNYVLEKFHSKLFSLAKTKELYDIYDLGYFPGIKPSENGVQIEGELFLINSACLKELDMIEGHPTFYERKLSKITLCDSTELEAYVYEWQGKMKYDVHILNGVTSWKKYYKILQNKKNEKDNNK